MLPNLLRRTTRAAFDITIRSMSSTRKLTTLELQYMKKQGKKISMVTAYDYPSAKHAENAEFDIVLVGDSLGMVVLGYETTLSVTMDDMLHHCKAARRGAPSRFIVGDLPFGSYESGPDEALKNAFRLIKESGVDAVKLEGGSKRAETIRKLVDSGVAVMGHIGLTPQGIGVLGGFRAQGRTAVKARQIVDDAIALQNAGAFALVIECVPTVVAKAVTDAVKIPVVGIGAGPHTTGQDHFLKSSTYKRDIKSSVSEVLVYHDLLGIMHHPHHEKHVPSFCKRYAKLGGEIHAALVQYNTEVKESLFPTEDFSPYKMSDEETEKFNNLMKIDEEIRFKLQANVEKKLRDADEYEVTKLY